MSDIYGQMVAEVTAEWLECFRAAKADGAELADSFFWRMALLGTAGGR